MIIMNKTMRNRVLRDVSKLITCDFNGEAWCAPDGYFATAYPIYDGYRIKKDQRAPDTRPDLSKVLRPGDYRIAGTIISVLDGSYTDISAPGCDITYRVNSDYYNFLMGIYPNAQAYIDHSGNKYAHVELKINGVLVAVIMPVKQ